MGLRNTNRRHMEWKSVVGKASCLPSHSDIIVSKRIITHPKYAGFVESVGEPQGQKADYRLTLKDGRSIHAREFQDHYKVHWDKIDPSVDPFGHMLEDAPHWLVIIGLLFLAGLGAYTASRSKYDGTVIQESEKSQRVINPNCYNKARRI